MPRPQAPWWMFVVAASFGSYSALLLYGDLSRPEHIGLVARFVDHDMIVTEVRPGSPAARSGMQVADRVIAIDHQMIHTPLDYVAIEANFDVGRPIVFELARAGRSGRATVVIGPALPDSWRSQEGVLLLTIRAVFGVTLALAAFVAFKRPYDVLARLGAWLLASVSVFSVAFQYRFAVLWRQVPPPADALFWVPFLSSLAIPGLILTFFAFLFPGHPLRSRRALALAWAPMLIGLAWHGYYGYRMVYVPDRAAGVPDFSVAFLIGSLVYVAGTVALIIRRYPRLRDLNERRRVRVVVLGSLLGLAGGLPVYVRFVTTAEVGSPFLGSTAAALGSLVFLAFPLSFAYAILRHRLFDVSVMIRQGVRYALARRVLLLIGPAVMALLLVDVTLHLDAGVLPVLQRRGWAYLTLGLLVLVARSKRVAWQDNLDRRFFRERYSAQRLLRQVVDDILDEGDLERIAPRVTAQIEAALHPERVALLVRAPNGSRYRTLATAPRGGAVDWLPADSKLMGLLRLCGRPLEVSPGESSWLWQQLPQEEQAFLLEAGIDLLVPVASKPGRAEAVLALGAKRSEEPYSDEDRELLRAIADALVLASNGTARTTETGSPLECPQCGSSYPAGTSRCSRDGSPLRTVEGSTVLAGRYRLEREVGRGGMATVYVALDTELGRHVAVKVIRGDLVNQAEAASRFRREARIAAGLVHPNIVTVHDVGVTADHHAFLVMEWLEGTTLREELRRQGRLPPPRVLDILRGVCAAVEAVHEQQLVHRDLKPENIFLVATSSGDNVKVLDFGIAKALLTVSATEPAGTTRPGIVVGTPRYMAPEQRRGEPPAQAWDIWALGVIAFEMITGEHPFGDAGVPAGPEPGLREPAALLRSLAPHASNALEAFFRRALSPDPAQRPASARAFFVALEQALSTPGMLQRG